MLNFQFTWDLGVSIEQMVGFRMAAAVWSHYLTDDITVKLHVASTNTLGNDGEAVGGAVPLFNEVQYGVFRGYYEDDITSENDTQAHGSLSDSNTVNLMINGELVDGNTNMLVTSAQAKALGMDQALLLDNGTTWDRDLVDPNALDGYILINNSFDWNYDFARENDATEQSLDFFSMALHEIGHQLGFVSGIDGTIDVLTLHSGETRIEDFTVLDLFRHTIDGDSVNDLTLGANAYFSLDGGATNLANFSTGDQDDDYQASHWQRFQTAIGVMDPTLAYQERLSLTELDLQAFDVLGYDINDEVVGESLDLTSLRTQAETAISSELGLSLAELTGGNGETEIYQLGYSSWWALFEKQLMELGYSSWWDIFEQGKEYWEQELAGETLELGYSSWWQLFDHKMNELESELLALGYSSWWQEFQEDMFNLGYSSWWQAFELGYSSWWQTLETYFSTLEETNGNDISVIDQIINPDASNDTTQNNIIGGENDDIIGGSQGKDLINGLKGDDLIDGKSGDDILLGDEGDDMIYGLDGDDVIYGGEGDDFIAGETDNDELFGEAGADIISGGAGDDFLSGGEGKDLLKGDQGIDILLGGTGDDALEGGDNNDLLLGQQGKDLLDGGAGDDILRGDNSSSTSNVVTTEVTTDTNGETNPSNSEPDLASLQLELGLVFEPTPTSGVNFWMRLEAESMELRNFSEKVDSNASEGNVIVTGGRGKAETVFTGMTGTYDIVVSYYDESTAQGEITFKIDRDTVDNWVLNQDSNSFVTKIIEGVTLTNGDEIKLEGNTTNGESLAIDYLDIISVQEGATYDYNNLSPEDQISLVKPLDKIGRNTFRLEAEDMSLSNGYQTESGVDFYSGNSVISNPISGQEATATYTFQGKSGIYNIFVSYLDGSGGNAQGQIKINGTSVNSWLFNANDDLTEYRLVELEVSLNEGDVIEVIGKADGTDLAEIDYLDFKSVSQRSSNRVKGNGNSNSNGNNSTPVAYITEIGSDVVQRVEAEQMSLTGTYKIFDENFASGLQLVQTDDKTSGVTATATFTGETGFYNIVLGYYDENDGFAQFNATLNGIQQLDSWQANLELGDHNPKAKTFVSRTISSKVLLNQGDEVQIQGIREDNDKASIDFIDFVAYDSTASIRVEAEYMNASGEYKLEEYDFASSGRVLRSEKDDEPDKALKLNTTFTGESGQYSIKVHYFDENDGIAQLSASLKTSSGTIKSEDSWLSNQDLGDNYPAVQNAVSRVVATNIDLETGDIFELTSIRNSGDYGRIDYVEFIPSTATNLEENAIQLEIEEMQLTGEKVKIKEKNFAHGGAYVETDNDTIGFTASTLFMDEEGYYDIILGYYDSNKGEASVTVKLNEDELNSWVLNQDFGTDKPGVESFTTYTVAQGVYLEKTDILQIIGLENNGDKVNADYIKLIPVEAPVSTIIPTNEISDTDNGDILRGGAGNDQLFGDEGNDLLYGEDEYDTPNSGNAGNDTIEGGSGDDTLYGNSGDDLLYGDGTDSAGTSQTPATNKTPATLAFQQGVNGYYGTVDTMIKGYFPDANNGSDTSLNVDGDDFGSPVHSLIRFNDIFGSQIGQIALDDTINSAILELSISEIDPANSIEIYEMLQTWTENSTWNSLGNGIQADGVEAKNTPVATTQYLSSGTMEIQIDVTASLQAWQANPNTNQGWALLPTGSDGFDFWSSEGSVAPRLVVDVNQNNTLSNIKVEAEDMTLGGGYFVEALDGVSGGEVIRNESNGIATLSFSGADGIYDVVVHYVDENDGSASLALGVNGVAKDLWRLNKNTGTTHFISASHTISGVNLSTSDSIQIAGSAEAYEYTRIDYVEFIPVDSTGSPQINSNLPNGKIYNGSLYSLTQADTWTNAQAEAESLGGNLVSINDALENQWLLNNFGTQSDTDTLWIGITKEENQPHEWVNGETVTYTNWGSGNPDDMIYGYQVVLDRYDEWYDRGWSLIQSYNTVQGIAEISLSDVLQEVLNQTGSNSTLDAFNDGVIYNGSLYLLSDAATWTNAQAQAESLGGNLVTINDEAENQFLLDNFGTQNNWLWTGLTDQNQEGIFEWASGEEVTYTNWAPGQPYDDGSGGGQDYAILGSGQGWDDNSQNFSWQGIIEINLSSLSTSSSTTSNTSNTGNDIITGNDTITGNSGNDNLFGGAGNDLLNGTDLVSTGKGEQDSLTGGSGADTFILGDANNAYYLGQGDLDFATITDFNPNVDRLELHGSLGDYQQTQQGDDLWLSYQNDLIAVLENSSTLSLNGFFV